MGGLLEAILINIIIPEVAAILRKKPDATDDQVITDFLSRRDRIIKKGRGFLSETASTPDV